MKWHDWINPGFYIGLVVVGVRSFCDWIDAGIDRATRR